MAVDRNFDGTLANNSAFYSDGGFIFPGLVGAAPPAVALGSDSGVFINPYVDATLGMISGYGEIGLGATTAATPTIIGQLAGAALVADGTLRVAGNSTELMALTVGAEPPDMNLLSVPAAAVFTLGTLLGRDPNDVDVYSRRARFVFESALSGKSLFNAIQRGSTLTVLKKGVRFWIKANSGAADFRTNEPAGLPENSPLGFEESFDSYFPDPFGVRVDGTSAIGFSDGNHWGIPFRGLDSARTGVPINTDYTNGGGGGGRSIDDESNVMLA